MNVQKRRRESLLKEREKEKEKWQNMTCTNLDEDTNESNTLTMLKRW